MVGKVLKLDNRLTGPGISCSGSEKFFTRAPFQPDLAIAKKKMPDDGIFFRGVFKGGRLKLLEVYEAQGNIALACLYLSNLNAREKVALPERLRKAGIPYRTIEVIGSTIKETLYTVSEGGVVTRTEDLLPAEIGLTIERDQLQITQKKMAFSRNGEPLAEETYDKDQVLLDIVDVRPPFARRDFLLPYEGIKCAYRWGFDSPEELWLAVEGEGRIELALPYNLGLFKRAVGENVEEVIKELKESQLEIATVHAVQAPISQPDFLTGWGEAVMRMADALGAETVTFHPNNLRPEMPREKVQQETLAMISELQAKHKAVIAVETFIGFNRVFRPADLVKYGIPMVLDVAHVSDEEGLNLIRNHSDLIRTIHLSAKGEEEIHHLPVDRFCLDVLEEAMKANWRGNVVLEYLPKYENLQVNDRLRLEKFLRNENG